MAFISVTRLRLRSARFLPGFVVRTFWARRQVQTADGFCGGSLLGDRHWTFWTLTAWDSMDSMRGYRAAGAHRAAMPRLLDWCDEASVVHWEQPDEALPSWTYADARMRREGRASKIRHPSPRHADLSYDPPRLSGAVPIPRR